MEQARPLSPVTRDFVAGILDPTGFRHADHVRVAYELLRSRDFASASAVYLDGIRSVTERAGVPEKANITITLAFLSVIAERMAGGDAGTYEAFVAANPDLMSMAVLENWYSPERLHSAQARTAFLMPEPARAS